MVCNGITLLLLFHHFQLSGLNSLEALFQRLKLVLVLDVVLLLIV